MDGFPSNRANCQQVSSGLYLLECVSTSQKKSLMKHKSHQCPIKMERVKGIAPAVNSAVYSYSYRMYLTVIFKLSSLMAASYNNAHHASEPIYSTDLLAGIECVSQIFLLLCKWFVRLFQSLSII